MLERETSKTFTKLEKPFLRKFAMFFFPTKILEKSVLSLARPDFLTGAIIETRFQASLPAPPGYCAHLETSFLSLKRVHLNLKSSLFQALSSWGRAKTSEEKTREFQALGSWGRAKTSEEKQGRTKASLP